MLKLKRWVKVPTGKVQCQRSTVSHTHNLSISGGDERTRYVVAGNIVHQDGILLNTGYQRWWTACEH